MTWMPIDSLDLSLAHFVEVECGCPCKRRMHAIWDEHETPGGVVRGFLAQDKRLYALRDFGRYRPLADPLPIDKADRALGANKNIREITSPALIEPTRKTVHWERRGECQQQN